MSDTVPPSSPGCAAGEDITFVFSSLILPASLPPRVLCPTPPHDEKPGEPCPASHAHWPTNPAPWQGRKALLPMRSNRAAIGTSPLPFPYKYHPTPTQEGRRDEKKTRGKEKEREREREREREERRRVWNKGGFEREINRRARSTKRETTWQRKKIKKNETIEERGRVVTSLSIAWNSSTAAWSCRPWATTLPPPSTAALPPPSTTAPPAKQQTSKAPPPPRQVTLLSPPLLLHFWYKFVLHAKQILFCMQEDGKGKIIPPLFFFSFLAQPLCLGQIRPRPKEAERTVGHRSAQPFWAEISPTLLGWVRPS